MFPVNSRFAIKAMKQNNSLIFYSNGWHCLSVLLECREMEQIPACLASVLLTNFSYKCECFYDLVFLLL